MAADGCAPQPAACSCDPSGASARLGYTTVSAASREPIEGYALPTRGQAIARLDSTRDMCLDDLRRWVDPGSLPRRGAESHGRDASLV